MKISNIHIILDACHMIKLVCNTLGDMGFMYDGAGNIIKWDFFKELVKFQEESGLHCATKLRKRHINYSTEKMRLKLAVQTLSASVGDALEYCAKDLNITAFQRSEATVTFCRNINYIFDVLNTRNFLGSTPYKKPLYKGNETFLESFIEESITYLSSLKSNNHTGILLTGCLISLKIFFNDVIKTDILKFLLSYKLSQDHLEMFFSAIRRRGGFSNNPTAWQFEQAYKRLLVHTEIISSDTANCLAQDETSILNVSSNTFKSNSIDVLTEEDTNSDFQEHQYLENFKDNELYVFV